MNKVVKNQAFYAQVLMDRQDFNKAAGFSASLLKLSDNTLTTLAGSFTELVKDVTPAHTATVSGETPIGRNYIKVVAGHNIADGDVIKDANDNMYYVMKAEATKLTLKQPVYAIITDASTLTQVGNTGYYKLPVTIDTVGKYTILVNNPAVDMYSYPISIEVLDNNEDTLKAAMDANTTTITGAITTSEGVITGAITTAVTDINAHTDTQISALQLALETALGNAQTAITDAISASESVVTGAIGTSEGVVTSAISTSEGTVTTAITNQTTHIDEQFTTTNQRIEEIANKGSFVVTI